MTHQELERQRRRCIENCFPLTSSDHGNDNGEEILLTPLSKFPTDVGVGVGVGVDGGDYFWASSLMPSESASVDAVALIREAVVEAAPWLFFLYVVLHLRLISKQKIEFWLTAVKLKTNSEADSLKNKAVALQRQVVKAGLPQQKGK